MKQPLVSVITPVLNRAEMIEGCLASVANQSWRRIEHIVVDGGSTDGTLELLRRHKARQGFRWLSEADGGMYQAINKGMSLAQGEVLAYLNSDDLYLPWSLDVAISSLTQRDLDLIYGDLGILQEGAEGKPLSFHIQFYPDFDLQHYSFVGTLGQPTVFWRRSLTERIGLFDTSYQLIGDCEYWLRAAMAGATLQHIPELLAVQVEHGSTLRATHATRLADEFDTLRRSMAEAIHRPRSLRRERIKQSIAWRARHLEFFVAMKAKHPKKWRHFVEALRAGGVDVSLRDLRQLAPSRWRGTASLFGDAPRIYELLTGPGDH